MAESGPQQPLVSGNGAAEMDGGWTGDRGDGEWWRLGDPRRAIYFAGKARIGRLRGEMRKAARNEVDAPRRLRLRSSPVWRSRRLAKKLSRPLDEIQS